MTRADVRGSHTSGESLLPAADTHSHGTPGATAQHSRLVQRLRRRYADELPLLAPGAPDAAALREALQRLSDQGHDTGAALRILRQLVMERLVVLDCEQAAPLEVVTSAVTQLAELPWMWPAKPCSPSWTSATARRKPTAANGPRCG